MLRSVDTVIVDEVHAVAGTKRGAHLALSLERLDALLAQARPADRPLRHGAPARGGGAVPRRQPPRRDRRAARREAVGPHASSSRWRTCPSSARPARRPGGPGRRRGAPHLHLASVEEQVVDLVEQHRSTIVFANSRRLAERLTARLNEIATERADARDGCRAGGDGAATGPPPRPPSAGAWPSPGSPRAPPVVIARAHHGSVSKDQRALIEDDLKRGRLPCVVATSSLELGIDMGAVDLVVQIESPPSVASALQRVGRAGHQVGEVSRGVLLPKHRADLVHTAVAVESMRAGRDRVAPGADQPAGRPGPAGRGHDVAGGLEVDEVYELVRRAASYASLPRAAFDATLDLLSGRYPSDEFAELRPRIVWDRVAETLTGRPGAQRLAVTSGGTIPDRGLFGVFLVGEKASRVGELDEEMVYESRVGDVFALGATSWRIEDITHDRVLVSPAPGQPGPAAVLEGRPARTTRRAGRGHRRLHPRARRAGPGRRGGALPRRRARRLGRGEPRHVPRRAAAGDLRAAHRTARCWSSGSATSWATGGWCCTPPTARRCTRPWALAIGLRLAERYGVDAQALASDDGIVMRIPESDQDPPGADVVVFDADEIEDLVTAEVGGSALFASRFRECAARALLLPRRDPGRRSPLWQQRQKSAQLLSVAVEVPVLPHRARGGARVPPGRLRRSRAGGADEAAVLARGPGLRGRTPTSPRRSPGRCCSATSRRSCTRATTRWPSAAPRRCRSTRVCWPSCSGAPSCASCSTRRCWPRSSSSCSASTPSAGPAGSRAWPTCVRLIGPLSTAEVAARVPDESAEEAEGWLIALAEARRVVQVRVAGEPRWAAVEDVPRLRDGLGVPVPPGTPNAFLDEVTDPLADLVGRYARCHGPFTVSDVAERWGLGSAVVRQTLLRLAGSGRVVEGEFRPTGSGSEWCDAEVLRRLRRRSLAALRKEVEPVEPATLGRFLPAWQNVIVEQPEEPRGSATAAPPAERRARGGPGCAASTACSRWSSSSPAAPCPPARWRRSCCRAGSRTTPAPTSTSSPPPARSSGPGRARCRARTAGCRCTSPTAPTSPCPSRRRTTRRRCTAASSTRWRAEAPTSSVSSATPPGRPTTPRCSPRCGTWCGPAG